jgi:hypothetical protein
LCELLAVASLADVLPSRYMRGTYMDSANFFSAKSLFPSAFSASAMIELSMCRGSVEVWFNIGSFS